MIKLMILTAALATVLMVLLASSLVIDMVPE